MRTLGSVVTSPYVALTELVANAWDAGASTVNINIPDFTEGEIIISDDGTGMTAEQFRNRWMKLGYDRSRHQGNVVEFPPERQEEKRRAYGRNGMGRHGLLCFANQYQVETYRDGKGALFLVETRSGDTPFALVSQEECEVPNHGTKLTAKIIRHLPNPEKVCEHLAERFLYDPAFIVRVNGQEVSNVRQAKIMSSVTLQITEQVTVDILIIELKDSSSRKRKPGVVFWVGGRLVGVPSWILGDKILLDGRTSLAKQFTIVVESNDLFEEVAADWSGFKMTETTKKMYAVVGDYITELFKQKAIERSNNVAEAALREHREEIKTLQPLAKYELEEFVQDLSSKTPTIEQETLSAAVKAVIEIEKKRSGTALLEKIARFSEEDISGLDRLLNDWTVHDALIVLDEIDQRISTIKAIEKLASDPKTDELHTLHPLITHSRWVFGPEFDSPEFVSNASLKTAAEMIFRQRIDPAAFDNSKKRPDLVILTDSTLSIVGTDEINETSGLSQMRKVLIIELKRGGKSVGRDEVHQAEGYVEDFLGYGILGSSPYFSAFVVGHKIQDKVIPVRTLGEKRDDGRIQACTYTQLVRTAELRLFRLKEKLENRYDGVSGTDLVNRILSEDHQPPLIS